MSDTKQLKKQMKILSKKELIQLIIAIDSVSQEQLNGHKKTINKLTDENKQLYNEIKEYRDALGIIYERSLDALEPTYEIDETYTCEILEECCSPETCNSEVCYCADDQLHWDMPKAERTNIDLDEIERPSSLKLGEQVLNACRWINETTRMSWIN